MALKKRYLIPIGILKETRKNILGHDSFERIIANILNKFHVGFVDDCCDNLSQNRPIRFNPANGKIEYYNLSNDTWLDTATYVVPTTTTSSSTTTTTTTP